MNDDQKQRPAVSGASGCSAAADEPQPDAGDQDRSADDVFDSLRERWNGYLVYASDQASHPVAMPWDVDKWECIEATWHAALSELQEAIEESNTKKHSVTEGP